jgi:hypothetical protein
MQKSESRDRVGTYALKRVWESLLRRARMLLRSGGRLMEWECFEDRKNRDDWRVEAIDFDNEGEVHVTIFSGPRVCPDFCVNGQVLFLGWGAGEGCPFPCPSM